MNVGGAFVFRLINSALVQEMELRITRVENVDGSTTLSQLARWLVKATIDDLTGGIGLFNDGETVKFYVTADKFAIIPPGATDDDGTVIPFAVTDGKVYIDTAVIRDASIKALKVEDGFFDNITAVKGTLAHANIDKGNVFDLSIGNVIQSDNFSSNSLRAVRGWRILRNGQFQLGAGAFNGDIQSTNFRSGSSGWRVRSTGDAEFDAGVIRGTLTADHIESDVFNAALLWEGSRQLLGYHVFRDFDLDYDWDDYDLLLFFYDGYAGSKWMRGVPTDEISYRSEIDIPSGDYFGDSHNLYTRATSDDSLRIRSSAARPYLKVKLIYGLQDPR